MTAQKHEPHYTLDEATTARLWDVLTEDGATRAGFVMHMAMHNTDDNAPTTAQLWGALGEDGATRAGFAMHMHLCATDDGVERPTTERLWGALAEDGATRAGFAMHMRLHDSGVDEPAAATA
ncbi:hypothetical protein JOD54_002049 [Actinokineospora baliensis]|uniref:hypothetical protein n=1 Tax=Actinokineospora baliensis TaxID=547056 RepID=UPI00195E4B72|nr:hypothetical protein [Actinokineospora baliensis]MBM7771845.1 hypothetical protein [Actinokineospora baliensis]